jgi:hypothetical protein
MRLPARLLLTGAAVIAVTSCSVDRAAAPTGSPTIHGSSVLRALVVAQTVDFVIPASGGTIDLLGAYTLTFPAGAVCDPNAEDTQTGYANQDWDAPCTPATEDIPVTAVLKYSNGNLYADFQKSLRFVPDKRVIISTSVIAGQVQWQNDIGDTQGWTIQYAPGIDAPGVSDALADPTVRTVVVGSTGTIFRRIKHFSGYVMPTGDGWVPCDPSAGDPTCVWVDDDGFGKGM